jgi:hypothetical protein
VILTLSSTSRTCAPYYTTLLTIKTKQHGVQVCCVVFGFDSELSVLLFSIVLKVLCMGVKFKIIN